MSNIIEETVLETHHWTENLFTLKLTRDPGFRFESGQFAMIGLRVDGKPLMRAYSMASASYEEHLEFLSIKVPNGPLTSRLQHVQPGDKILVNRKTTGTLIADNLLPGAKRLYLLSTGTGLAPFLSIIKDPETYERFANVILVHGVRYRSELAYKEYIEAELKEHQLLGEQVRAQLIYFPTVTREPFRIQGRITELIESGRLFQETAMPPLDPASDRAMVCGGPDMIAEVSALLDSRGFHISPSVGEPGDYVIERAFVAK